MRIWGNEGASAAETAMVENRMSERILVSM
jgi:hypothetical protein